MESTPQQERIYRKTRRKNYMHVKSTLKKIKPQVTTSTPVSQNCETSTALETWLQTSNENEQILMTEIPLVFPTDDQSSVITRQSKTQKNTESNIALKNQKFLCKSDISINSSSTGARNTDLPSDNCFGFDKLLEETDCSVTNERLQTKRTINCRALHSLNKPLRTNTSGRKKNKICGKSLTDGNLKDTLIQSQQTAVALNENNAFVNVKITKLSKQKHHIEAVTPTHPDSMVSEDLFGFEKLLGHDHDIVDLPKTKHAAYGSRNVSLLSSTVLAEKQPLRKSKTPWSGLLETPEKKFDGKKVSTKRKAAQLKENISLFGENESSPSQKFFLKIDSVVLAADKNANSSGDEDPDHKKNQHKKQTKCKSQPRKPVVPDIQWKEIMEHELVIE